MVVRKIQPFVDISTPFAEWARDERILSVVRQLMGDANPELMEDKFSYKQYLVGTTPDVDTTSADAEFHPHADYAYHVAHGYPPTIITCAVALDDCTAEKGPFHVWPGTHKEFTAHADLGARSHIVEASKLAGREERDVLVSAGTAIFFSDLLVHNSKPNRSRAPRRMTFFSYCPAGYVVDPDVRNAPTRRLEREHEMRYLQFKERGQYHDTFSAPSEID
jgi:ectoine hydroxylase-related dioxygenase (phytanoyl-CoA dioxygenase family)